MEFVPLSDTVLNYLAEDDRELKPYFRGVFLADKLPPVSKKRVNAYIITDPASQPGEHWLAIWIYHTSCEVFDSYGLPLSTYKNPTLQAWLKQWKEMISSDQPLQAMDSFTCRHYALFFLKAKARHASFQDFLAQWHSNNLVLNDRRVGEQLQRLIKTELNEYQQSNVNGSSFDYFYQLVYQ